MIALLVILAAVFGWMAPLHAQVSAGGMPRSLSLNLDASPPTVTMGSVDVDALLLEDEQEDWGSVGYRFGAPFEVSLNPANSGSWTELPEGRLWRLRIESPGAHSINLLYDQFSLPEGGELFLYNDDRLQVIGAFTSYNNKQDGSFATQPVAGDAVTLEYFEPSAVRGQGSISIWRVVHAYRNLFGRRTLDDFGDAAECNVNVNCPVAVDWQENERRSVAMILTGMGTRWCTGSLINNTANDARPLFHTAKHCTDGQNTSSWLLMFNYESPGCDDVDGPTDQSVSNATLLFSHIDTDVALLEISVPIPNEYEPYFNGWSAEDVAPTSSVCISHPMGDIKKIGIDEDPAVSSDFPGTPDDSHWRVIGWEFGHAEHGSSGSPLFDQSGRVVGQCHGGDGWCQPVCNVDYGKISMSYTLGLEEHLDPAGTGTLTLDGLDLASGPRVIGTVRHTESQTPLPQVHVEDVGGTRATWTNAAGEYVLVLDEGIYDLRFSKWGYVDHTELGVTVSGEDTVELDVDLDSVIVVTAFAEDFETGGPGWTHESAGGQWLDEWHLSAEQAHSGTQSYKCGDTGAGSYSNLNDARLMSPVIEDLPQNSRLSLWMRIESETSGLFPDSAYDGGTLEIDSNSTGFFQIGVDPRYTHAFRWESNSGTPASGPMPGLPCWAGEIQIWTEYTADLSDFQGKDIQLRFRFGSDAGATREGWYVDDVVIQGVWEATPVTGLVIQVVGDDVLLSWDEDLNPFYRVFSSSESSYPFPLFEGTTDQNNFTIVDGAFGDRRFFYVEPWMGN